MSINTAMLVGLGFLVAALLAVLIAPAYRRRTVRLTTDALKRSLPLTEAEMRADKDRLRAEHAIRIHNLESNLERVTLSSARQRIEVNRRDARISELEGNVNGQKNQIDELENARRVLEQTITDRLPRIEARLLEARKMLAHRDTEVATLAETAQKQARALAEATQINVHQTAEIERLSTALATRAARNHDTLADARFDGEVALRSEMEALRAKNRDQMALIGHLQELISDPKTGSAPEAIAAVSGAVGAVQSSKADVAQAEATRLQAELAQAQGDVQALRASVAAELDDGGATSAELSRLRAANRDLAAEGARLKAALAAFEAGDVDKRTKESPIAMKAKISALEAQAREQATTIASLRAEAAAINERLARQAAHYMDEMKRLGAGTLPASGEARLPRPDVKRSLSDRLNDPRVVRLTPLSDKRPAAEGAPGAPVDAAPAGGFSLPAVAMADAERPSMPSVPSVSSAPSVLFSLNDQPAAASAPPVEPAAAGGAAASMASGEAPSAPPRRPRLLERITEVDKSGSK